MRLRTRTPLLIAATASLVFAACSDDGPAAEPPATADATTTTAPADMTVVDGQPFPAARCAANEAAGKITFLTGFDYAAAASIIDVVTAQDKGYYEALCLDVEVRASSSTANYPLVASNDAQFASGGSFSEVLAFEAANDADFSVLSVDGRTAIDTLIIKAGEATTLDDLRGKTLGVIFKLPPAIEAMLLQAGLVEGVDFQTVPLEGFDVVAQFELEQIVGRSGWKSNEVAALQRAGIAVTLFDPLDFDIPGSFGAIFGNAEFIAAHPTAAEDFMRATMKGLTDAIADPEAAANAAVALINANGNPFFLSPEGEVFRWQTEADLIAGLQPEGVGYGVPDSALLEAEVAAYAEIGLFGDGPAPDVSSILDTAVSAAIHDADGAVIWPS